MQWVVFPVKVWGPWKATESVRHGGSWTDECDAVISWWNHHGQSASKKEANLIKAERQEGIWLESEI